MPMKPETALRKFWEKTNQQPYGCWLWGGKIDPSGYGRCWVNNREVSAHRRAWELTHGQIVRGCVVKHTCKSRRCCNPDHLYLNTDKVIFTPDQIERIITSYQSKDPASAADIGALFGVSQTPILRVLRAHGISLKKGPKPKWPIVKGQKQCRTCLEWKDLGAEFAADNLSYRSDCNTCRARQFSEEGRLKKFGISTAQYEAMLADQNGVCAICKKKESIKLPRGRVRTVLAIDHNHSTGQIRGLLCSWCNRAIGYLRDDADRAAKVAIYLRKWARRANTRIE